jgi:hypothetical protein
MTAKEKAKELFKKFRRLAHSDWDPQTGFDEQQCKQNAIECALIAVEEIKKQIKESTAHLNRSSFAFWVNVQNELNKM